MTTKVMDCDLLVIGAGGIGSICAGKAADLLPGKKIIVIEKAKKPGGATIFGHGAGITDSTWQRDAGAEPMTPQDNTGQFWDWLVSKGEADAKKYFKLVNSSSPFGGGQTLSIDMPRRIDKYKALDDASIGPGWWGSYIVDKMMECCNKAGVPVLTGTRAKKFLKDSSGRITGIIAETKDGELRVNFKACFIGSGGFGADYKRCQELWPKVFNNIPMHNLNPPSLTGDLLDAAQEAGAGIDLDNTWANVQGPIHHPYSYTVVTMTRSSVMRLQVNLEGGRVNDPGGGGGTGRVTPNPRVYSIADKDILERAGELAADFITEEYEHERAKDHWRDDVEEEMAVDEKWGHGRHITKADTLVDLALKIKINPNVLRATVDEYNKECESGEGQVASETGVVQGGGPGGRGNDFFQGSTSPMPVKNGPFYAVFSQRFRQCTHGGIIVNVNHEVLDTKGNVMPGLYAGGDCATEYTVKTGDRTEGQGGGPSMGGIGIFGNYTAHGGGGMAGIYKGYSAAISIAGYLGKV